MIKMVGTRLYGLEGLLSEKQVRHVVRQAVGTSHFQLQHCDVTPATDGLAGFLGDHLRATLYVEIDGYITKIYLFLKSIPAVNKPKAEFINENNYFRREMFMYKVLEEIGDGNEKGENRWYPKAYLYTDSIVVMPDLAVEGYSPRHYLQTFDLPHVLLTLKAVARFHASVTNYETRKSLELKCHYSSYKEHQDILTEPTFCDSPWLRACAKLTVALLRDFSTKPYRNILDLESQLYKLYLEACDSLTEKQNTLNVFLHKDLWANNIMFKYENGVPKDTMIIDFQCLRYGPPTFDIMSFLYLTTTRSFREQHEKFILEYYYQIFCKNLNEASKQRLKGLGYDKSSFLEWCEYSRMFGMFEAIAIYPFILMDPKTAQKTFDDPQTYEKYINEDRSEPVIEYAKKCREFRERQLSVSEEFIERYAVKEL